MLVLISPAKKQHAEIHADRALPYTRPTMLKATQELIEVARSLSHKQMADLMRISDKLVELNRQRYRDFSLPFTKDNARQAVLTFMGDTYRGLDAASMSAQDLDYAQKHLRILSGLYGLLRPLDLIQAYRLEMGIKMNTGKGGNLYEFWGQQITRNLNKSFSNTNSQYLINCASNEYFRALQPDALKADVITPVFSQVKDGQVRMMGMMAKRARGAMARYLIQNRIDRPEGLKDFSVDGYRFQARVSDSQIFEFYRQA